MSKQYDGLTFEHYDPAPRKQPIPTTGIFDVPANVICINVEWLGFVSGAISRLAWEEIWEGTDNEIYGAIQEIYKLLSALAGGSCMFQLRQNPDVPCLMEQSFDGGLTWADAFNYSLCQTPTSSGTIINMAMSASLIINNNIEIYEADPSGYAPEIANNDADTNTAYCYALRAWVQAAISTIIERKESDNNAEGMLAAASAVFAASAEAIFGGPLAVIATALVAGTLAIREIYLNALELEDLKALLADPDNVDKLVCCAYGALENNRLTPAIYADMWDGLCPDISGDLADVVNMFTDIVDEPTGFISFMDYVATAWTLADAGIIASDCDDCDIWCVTHVFTGAVANGWAKLSTSEGAGTLENEGWEGEDIQLAATEGRRSVAIERDLGGSGTLTHLHVTGDFVLGGYSDPGDAILFIFQDTGASTTVYSKTNSNAPEGQNISWEWSDPVGEVADNVILFYRSSKDVTLPFSYGGGITLHTVQLCGEYPKPGGL